MAKQSFNTFPIDTAHMQAPPVRMIEGQLFATASQSNAMLGDAIGTRKGNRIAWDPRAPKAAPYKNARNGR